MGPLRWSLAIKKEESKKEEGEVKHKSNAVNIRRSGKSYAGSAVVYLP